jgi:hypothetical protein
MSGKRPRAAKKKAEKNTRGLKRKDFIIEQVELVQFSIKKDS